MGQGMMMPKENGETGHSVRISLFFFEQKKKKKKKYKSSRNYYLCNHGVSALPEKLMGKHKTNLNKKKKNCFVESKGEFTCLLTGILP